MGKDEMVTTIDSNDPRIQRFFEISKNAVFNEAEVKDIVCNIGINTVIKHNWLGDISFLWQAICDENELLVAFLLQLGADPNLETENLDPVIWETRYFDNNGDYLLRIARLLLEHGADPNSVRDGEAFSSYIDYLPPPLYSDFNKAIAESKFLCDLSLLLFEYGGRTCNE